MVTGNVVATITEVLQKEIFKVSLVPLESSISLPVPFLLKSRPFIKFLFFTGSRSKADKKIQVFPPNARVVIDYPLGRIVVFENLMALGGFDKAAWKEPIGLFPHREIEALTLNDYSQKRKELMTRYDSAIESLRDGSQDVEFRADFKTLFYELCEPCLIPYLKRAGKRFFEWLDN